jgi:hypothetical protein
VSVEDPPVSADPRVELLDAAFLYGRDAGVRVFRCEIGGKQPLPGVSWPAAATADPDEIERLWFDAFNIGCPTGAALGAFVLDVDGADGEASLAAIEELHGALPPTRTARTPRGGRHLWFQFVEGATNRQGSRAAPVAGDLSRCLDVRGEGGFVVLPPSRRPEGSYFWTRPHPVADAPPWLIDWAVRGIRPRLPMPTAAPVSATPPRAVSEVTNRQGSRADVDELKARLSDPAGVAALLGLAGRREGQGVKVRCPWHDDGDPSCSLSRGADGGLRVRCFSCDARGDVLALIARVYGLDPRTDFARVLAQAQALAGMTSSSPPSPPPAPPLSASGFGAVFGALAAHAPASADAEAAAHLQSRGLTVSSSWACLPREPAAREALRRAVEGTCGAGAWQRAGLAAWTDHRLVIPWRDPGGACYAWQRRLLRPARPSEERYIASKGAPLTHPWGVEKPDPGGECVFVEGAFDALSWAALAAVRERVCRVLGIPGARGWRSSWATLAAGRRAVVALDADRAGEDAAAKIIGDLYGAGATEVVRARPVRSGDWNDALVRGAG